MNRPRSTAHDFLVEVADAMRLEYEMRGLG